MSRHRHAPSLSGQSSTSRSSTWSGLLLAFALLIGLMTIAVFGRLLLEKRLVLGPTPTITRLRASTDTPTADFRATINIAEIITQGARKVELAGINTPTRDVTATPLSTETPLSIASLEATQPVVTTPTRGTGFLPDITGPGTTILTPTAMATDSTGGINVQTPTPQPGEATQTAVAGIQATLTAEALLISPTATDTLAPTDTPMPTATNTPLPAATPTTPIVVIPLRAVTTRPTKIYAGPSVLYPFISELAAQENVSLIGRTVSGEWVRVCCNGSVDGWARQAFFQITEPTPTPPVDEASRLAVVQTTAVPLAPQLVPTDIPNADFPLYRRDQAGTGRVDTTFRLPLTRDDSFSLTALVSSGNKFSSPPVVIGSRVIAASDDERLYNLDKMIGNQNWRRDLGTVIEFTPVVQDSDIYVVDQKGEIIALIDAGGSSLINWRNPTNVAPSAPLNIYGDILLMPGSDHVLYAFNRLSSGSQRWSTFVPEQSLSQSPNVINYPLQYPAIGDQMLYVGDYALSALDVYSGTLIWRDTTISGMAGPPVYGRPGVTRLAEVYAADRNGVIHALDANTGVPIWRKGFTLSPSDRPTALAIDEQMIYASGLDFISAKDRRTGEDVWRKSFNIGELNAPIVANGYLLIVGSKGNVLVLDVSKGETQGGSSVPVNMVGPPAVSDGEIFLTGGNGQMHKIK